MFNEFGKQLLEFPQRVDERVLFEHGQDGFGAYYLRLLASVSNVNGQTALHVIASNAVATPYRAEFAILADAAELNRLGQMLAGWNFETHPVMTWQVPSD